MDSLKEFGLGIIKRKERPTHILRSTVFSPIIAIGIMLSVFAFVGSPAEAYTVVVPSTSAPAGLEALFLANATNYINSTLFVNPFAKNTYQLTLLGLNPNYVPPVNVSIDTTTWFSNIQAMQAISTNTYLMGYAQGTTDQVYREIGVSNGYYSLCSSTRTWLVPGSTSTYTKLDSTTTCTIVLDNLDYSMYQLLYATYTPKGF